MDNIFLQFDFENHNGELHQYIVKPKSVQLQACDCFKDQPGREAWCITADVLFRDGHPRPAERTFAIIKMESVTEIESIE